jgi:hypothetical protein
VSQNDKQFYPIELDIKDIINIDKSSTYIDLNLEFDNEGRLRMRLYDKRDDFHNDQKIAKGQSEAVNGGTDNTMTKGKGTNNDIQCTTQ